MKFKFFGQIIDGKLKLENPIAWNDHIKSLNSHRVELTLDKHRKPRSLNQNAYYWSVIVKMVADDAGYAKNEQDKAHDGLRLKFLRVKGDKLDTIKSTTELSTIEAEEYYENIRRWAAEGGLIIPEPHQVDLNS